MAITHNLTLTFGEGTGEQIAQTISKSQDAETNLDASVPDASTDLQIAVEIDVSALESFFLVSDQDVLIETNDGTTPDDSFNLKANEPIAWWNGSPLPNPFASGVDVVALYVTNSSGAAARVQLKTLQDPTP